MNRSSSTPCLRPRVTLALAALVFPLACATVLLPGCKEKGKFGGSTQKPTARQEAEAAGETLATQTFVASQSSSGQVNVLWVIDNSGSMGGEIATVEQNFQAFMTGVKAAGNVSVALLSSAEKPSTDTYAPKDYRQPRFDPAFVAGLGLKHINMEVGSRNLLDLAAVALCDAQASDVPRLPEMYGNELAAASFRICGQTVTKPQGERPREVPRVSASALPGSLKEFVSQSGKLVLVFVTDDDARVVTSQNFLDLLKAGGIANTPTVFAFGATRDAALDASGRPVLPGGQGTCDPTRRSASYQDLASRTGGGFFDMCDDWKPHFDAITAHVVKVAKRGFALDADPTRVVEILVDGVALRPEQYTLDGRNVTFVEGAVPSGAQSVSITYSTTAPRKP